MTEAFLATSSLAADFQGNIAATGNIAVGLPAGEQAQRPLHVEGSETSRGAEIHSGGSGGGYSFADRTSGTPAGSFVESPTKGERWVWYAEGGVARLWSGGDVMSVDTSGGVSISNGQLSVANANPSTAATAVTANCTNGTAVCAESNNGTAIFATGKTYALDAIGPSTFIGNVNVSQTLTAHDKQFLIDHPGDPENKTLTHACLESDERFNVYSGNIQLDENGEARATLPKCVDSLGNRLDVPTILMTLVEWMIVTNQQAYETALNEACQSHAVAAAVDDRPPIPDRVERFLERLHERAEAEVRRTFADHVAERAKHGIKVTRFDKPDDKSADEVQRTFADQAAERAKQEEQGNG